MLPFFTFQNFLIKLEFLLESSTLSQDLDPDVDRPLWIILWFANLDSLDQHLLARISWDPVPSPTSKRPLWNSVARVLSLFLEILILTRRWELPWGPAISTKERIVLLLVIMYIYIHQYNNIPWNRHALISRNFCKSIVRIVHNFRAILQIRNFSVNLTKFLYF